MGVRLNTSASPKAPIVDAAGPRAESVRGIEQHRDAADAAERFDARRIARRAEHVRGNERARPVERRPACSRGRSGSWPGRTRRSAGVRPFHDAAWQEAENVKLGITTGPGRPSMRACSVSISPEVQELTRDDVRHAQAVGGALLELGDERRRS